MRLASPSIALFALLAAAGCAPRYRAPAPPRPPPPPLIVAHRVSVPWLPPSVARFAPLLDQASAHQGVDANLLAIVVLVESGGDPRATSPDGAEGLMQLMPDTAADVARWRGFAFDETRLTEPAYNLDLGAWYLGQQIRRFWTGQADSTVADAAGAYNGGPGRMRRHLATGEPLPNETARYQRWVVGMWHERFFASSPTFVAWWNAGGSRLVAQAASPRLGLAAR